MGEFVDYVHQQQQQSHKAKPEPDNDSAYGTQSAVSNTSDHAELDILDSLGLSEQSPRTKLRYLFLDTTSNADESIALLQGHINGRLEKGFGETVFDLGFEDDGTDMSLTRQEWDVALERLRSVASMLTADCSTLLTINVGGEFEVEQPPSTTSFCSGKIMVRRRTTSIDDCIETRIAVVGNVDAGKSTMLGVLVKGGLDDGRGKARVNLFRHKHEFETGRTSSVGLEILGFDSIGNTVTSAVAGRKLSWNEVGTRSAKIICFSDLAGHERYLRTTCFGMLSSEPNYCLLMVAANNGLIGIRPPITISITVTLLTHGLQA